MAFRLWHAHNGSMTIKLSEKDHRAMDRMIDAVLDSYAKGEVSLGQARSVFAHVITAAAIANETEVRGWLKPETIVDWLKEARRA
jgi:hypothetical protein